jgi:N-acetylneuraminic acid mutarotase
MQTRFAPKKEDAGVIDGVVYVVGGVNTPFFPVVTTTVETYDSKANAWTTKAPMPTARSGAAAGVIDGILYVAGGTTTTELTGALEAYDPATNSLSTKASVPTPQRGDVRGRPGWEDLYDWRHRFGRERGTHGRGL